MLRFSIPAFVLAFLLLSVALGSLKDGRWKLLWAGAVVISALFCLPQYFSLSANWYNGWGIWSGGEHRQAYVARKTAFGHVTQWVNETLPRDATLLFVGDAQVLYFERPAYANSVFDEQFFSVAAREEKDPEGILRKLKEMGITHVIIHEALGAIHSKEYRQYELNKDQWRKIDDFVQMGLDPLMDDAGVRVYRVLGKLLVNGPRLSNPFVFFPLQWWDFNTDLDNKNYFEAELKLNELKNFFPGDPQLARAEIKLRKMEKGK